MKKREIYDDKFQIDYFSDNYLKFEEDFYRYSAMDIPLTFLTDDIMRELAISQKNYFLFQDDLKECTLKEIAQESGYSISTVSRTLSDKYYEFNDHMYPVKDLFISKTHKGSSKDSIQKAIQLLIEVEKPEKPLQDEEIVEELENMELYASRRTISKYRKELNIPNSKQRKKARL